jgi:putative ABC transport system permease protein
MNAMGALTLKGLWAHKLRYLLTGLAVVLGVAFMAGTMVLTDTMQSTFDDVVASANQGVDVLVRSDESVDGMMGETRRRIEASVVDRVAEVDGVAAAQGTIAGYAQLVRSDGEVVENDLGVTVGANWIDDERLNPFSIADGRAPEADDEVVLDARTAEDDELALGDTVTVLTLEGPVELTLVGTAAYGELDGLPGSTMVATTDAAAQRYFGEDGRYDAVVVAADEDVAPADLAASLTDAVAAAGGLEVITGEQDTADKQADLQKDLSFFNTFLKSFAYVALFVGTFIIYNTFSIVVAQRVKELAMLRAIGARSRQVLRAVLLESVIIGLVASAIGLAAGVGLSFGLRALLASVGLEIPSGPLVISSGTVTTAFVIGLTVSILSALVPAVRASRVKPITALRDVAIDRSGASVGRVVAGTAVTGLGGAAFAAGIAAEGTDGLPMVGLGALVVLIGVLVLGPVLVRPAIRFLGSPIAASGTTGHYARENAQRSPKRTAATSSALMIGVALVGFITILASSTTASLERALDRAFHADFVISSVGDQGFATSIEQDMAAADTVAVVSPLRMATAEVDGDDTTEVYAVEATTIGDQYDLDLVEGSIADIDGDGVAITLDQAEQRGLAIGDQVDMTFADGGQVVLTVRAIYDSLVPGPGSGWMVDLGTFDANVADQLDWKLFVSLDDGVSAEEARADIDAALTRWPNVEVQDSAQFKDSATEEIGQILNLVYGLLALAVVIALIGIANTLALSVHERTRELGLLRAIGMHRNQLRRAIRWESVLIAGLGASLGGLLAVGGAWGLVTALDTEGITQLTFPVPNLLVILALAVVAGVVAATGPARRAARLDVLEAIASE